MATTFVIKRLNVIEDGQAGLLLGRKHAVLGEAFSFIHPLTQISNNPIKTIPVGGTL